jgi:hypothetical protein
MKKLCFFLSFCAFLYTGTGIPRKQSVKIVSINTFRVSFFFFLSFFFVCLGFCWKMSTPNPNEYVLQVRQRIAASMAGFQARLRAEQMAAAKNSVNVPKTVVINAPTPQTQVPEKRKDAPTTPENPSKKKGIPLHPTTMK